MRLPITETIDPDLVTGAERDRALARRGNVHELPGNRHRLPRCGEDGCRGDDDQPAGRRREHRQGHPRGGTTGDHHPRGFASSAAPDRRGAFRRPRAHHRHRKRSRRRPVVPVRIQVLVLGRVPAPRRRRRGHRPRLPARGRHRRSTDRPADVLLRHVRRPEGSADQPRRGDALHARQRRVHRNQLGRRTVGVHAGASAVPHHRAQRDHAADAVDGRHDPRPARIRHGAARPDHRGVEDHPLRRTADHDRGPVALERRPRPFPRSPANAVVWDGSHEGGPAGTRRKATPGRARHARIRHDQGAARRLPPMAGHGLRQAWQLGLRHCADHHHRRRTGHRHRAADWRNRRARLPRRRRHGELPRRVSRGLQWRLAALRRHGILRRRGDLLVRRPHKGRREDRR